MSYSRCDQIRGALDRYRFNFRNEAELQAGVALALEREGIAYLREHRLNAQDRPDFFCDGIVIECKIAGSWAALVRQLARYAEHADVLAIIVVSSCAAHGGLPAELNGKPILQCSAMRGCL